CHHALAVEEEPAVPGGHASSHRRAAFTRGAAAHPLPALPVVAGTRCPLVVFVPSRMAHLRHRRRLPGVSARVGADPMPEVRDVVGARGLVRGRHASPVTVRSHVAIWQRGGGRVRQNEIIAPTSMRRAGAAEVAVPKNGDNWLPMKPFKLVRLNRFWML